MIGELVACHLKSRLREQTGVVIRVVQNERFNASFSSLIQRHAIHSFATRWPFGCAGFLADFRSKGLQIKGPFVYAIW